MKSRYDFGTDDQYYEYLVHYYAGQVASATYGNAKLIEELSSVLPKMDADDIMAAYIHGMALAIVERIKKGV